jgi:hypothetical protein
MRTFQFQDAPFWPQPAPLTDARFWAAELIRRRPMPVAVHHALLALVPGLLAGLGAMLLGTPEWCHGAVRDMGALLVGSTAATATLLICSGLHPANMPRAIVLAVVGGLAAAMPLVLGR